MKSDQASSDRYQDLGRSGRAHCKLGSRQQCFGLIFANVDRHQRVSPASLKIEIEFVTAATRRIRPNGVRDHRTAFARSSLLLNLDWTRAVKGVD